MATGSTWEKPVNQIGSGAADALSTHAQTWGAVILKGLASLKITVTLFALSIFIVLVGTLAQVDMDMWEVIDRYFRSWIATIELQVFFPRSWFPNHQNIPGVIWFPGGALIGTAMAINLLAAHSIRFRPQAKGERLVGGLAALVIGSAMTAYVIVSGHNHAGLQGEPPVSWQAMWQLVKIAVGLGALACAYVAMTGKAGFSEKATDLSRSERRVWWLTTVGLAGLAGWLFLAQENAYLGDSGMRILWQLIQSTVCGLVLLAGCSLIFGKRGGVVLIHAGIGLMMFGQFFVAKYDVEEQMRIGEGETRDFAEDIRQFELAIVDSSSPTAENVVAIPKSLLLASAGQEDGSLFGGRPAEVDEQGIIRHASLPFDVQMVDLFRNADLRDARPGEPNRATAGLGQRMIAAAVKPSSGTDMGGGVDLAAGYVRLLKKDGSGEIGTYLVSQLLAIQDMTESVTVDGRNYQISLRFRRNYKPYQVTLKDVRKDDYVGTATPRNYSSDIQLTDSSREVDREIRIWMNNPLRYAGETFYQSGYQGPPDSQTESTTLSIVTNAGWMIPYVSCMIVCVGLCAHFGQSLVRYLRREDRLTNLAEQTAAPAISTNGSPAAQLAKDRGRKGSRGRPEAAGAAEPTGRTNGLVGTGWRPALVPAIVISPFAVLLFSLLLPPRVPEGAINLQAFGQLPVIADGRVKPFDTLARNTLRVLSNRESFRDRNGESQPAIRWFLDVVAHHPDAERHQVFRIDNLEVLQLFKLDKERRKSHLYSVEELMGGVAEFERQVEQAQEESRRSGAEKLTVYQRKLLELDRRIRAYTRLAAAFQPPALPPLPTREEFEKDRAAAEQKLSRFRDVYLSFVRSIDSAQPPLAVPMKSGADPVHQDSQEGWQPYSKAWAAAIIDAQLLAKAPAESLRLFNEMLAAYSEDQASRFNSAVADYTRLLASDRPPELQAASSFWNRWVTARFGSFYAFEAFFNRISPFYFCWWPYLMAGVLAAISWLGWQRTLTRGAFWLLVFAFAIHTLALGARIYISGRPPVTNLYSSAVFIGWAVVLFCLVWERIYRDGIASFLASALGFASLLVAHMLAGDGDTFTVLQAVLDTQFWLATHVVSISLGYAATFLAGGIGIVYIARGLLTPSLGQPARHNLARMIYGTTCFAMLFSFVGTVLGGLWADDSWGRFWGWDPKENGALIIVLWNALVLHALWDGMVRDRGLAVLSVGGNIVTSWSWFGVNELGVGLHSYGFTEGVLLALALFVGSQLAIIGIGCLPWRWWWSVRRELADR